MSPGVFPGLFFALSETMETLFTQNVSDVKIIAKFAAEKWQNMELIDKIVHTADRLFTRFGVRSVTMDDVAREISISKKTLYKCFRDKDELVRTTISEHIRQMDKDIERIMSEEPDPVLQIARIAEFVMEVNRNVNPSVMYDLRKYHHECYNDFVNHRDTHTFNSVKQNLSTGIELGLYRPDLDLEVITRVYGYLVYSLFDQTLLGDGQVSFDRAFAEIVKYHLNAITTPAGKKRMGNIQWLHTNYTT